MLVRDLSQSQKRVRNYRSVVSSFHIRDWKQGNSCLVTVCCGDICEEGGNQRIWNDWVIKDENRHDRNSLKQWKGHLWEGWTWKRTVLLRFSLNLNIPLQMGYIVAIFLLGQSLFNRIIQLRVVVGVSETGSLFIYKNECDSACFKLWGGAECLLARWMFCNAVYG